MMRRSIFLAMMFAVGSGCSDSKPTEQDPTPSASATGTFSALLNSEPIKGDSGKAYGTASGSGQFRVVAYDSSRTTPISMVLSLFNIDQPGIYPMGVEVSATGGSIDLKVGSAMYHQLPTGNGGTIVLTHVSPTRLAGTFYMNFLYPTVGPAGSNVALTEAKFDVPIVSTGSIAVPENKGGWAVGTVGSKFWRSAIFEAGKGPDGWYGIRTGNSDYEVSLGFRNISEPGTYDIGPTGIGGIVVRSQRFTWELYPGGDPATMTITSFSADRVIGSVSARLLPKVGSENAGDLPVRISFDIGLAPP